MQDDEAQPGAGDGDQAELDHAIARMDALAAGDDGLVDEVPNEPAEQMENEMGGGRTQ